MLGTTTSFLENKPTVPALQHHAEITAFVGSRGPAFFLDFDGTLVPIVSHPDLVRVPEDTEELLASLASRYLVCIVSGRDLSDLRRHLSLPTLYYAGDHGHQVIGPVGSGIALRLEPADARELQQVASWLEEQVGDIPGVVLEVKSTSLAVHYRLVEEKKRPLVVESVRRAARDSTSLVMKESKLAYELRGRTSWDKGRAVSWVLEQAKLNRHDTCPICIGDDDTDEDMFRAVSGWGVTAVVGALDRPTVADYSLADPGEVGTFLRSFLDNSR